MLTLFEREADGRYTRSDEEQAERCYSFEEIRGALDACGFDLLSVSNGYDREGRELISAADPAALPEDTERWYFAARRKDKK